MILGVIFDLGDTLVTQEPLLGGPSNLDGAAAVLPIIHEHSGGSLTAEDLALVLGETLHQAVVESYDSGLAQPDTESLVRDALEQLDCSLPRQDIPPLLDVYFQHHFERMEPLGEVIQTLTLARRLSLKLGLFANILWGAEILRDRLRRLGISGVMDSVVCSTEIGWMKPYPGAFREILRRMDMRPAEAVMVGDDVIADVAGAQRAGLKAIWKRMDAGSDPPEGIRPNQMIEDIRQLLPAVASLM